ncbi:MAG: 4-alpha-glucanotransferase [Deferribacteres bacterium]|nr:4-alpha-glucanotransferase [Deferribacteres bacterium]
MEKRGSGILLHITSLPSPYGIGDLGPDAYRFVDFLAETHQSFWQILPLTRTCPAYGNSPYSSFSALAGNPLLISPRRMAKEGFIQESDIVDHPSFSATRVDYKAVAEYKEKIFTIAYKRIRDRLADHHDFRRFCNENGHWLDDYSLFISIKQHLKGIEWGKWPEELRDKKEEAVREWTEKLSDNILKEKFLQYIFFNQWYALKNYCDSKGIQIFGDIPIYVNYDSSDVWANPAIFRLDEEKKPAFVAGVPPDYFSSTGQLWGHPVYNWDVLKETRYAWWINRIEHNLRLFHLFRLDHFRGFVGYWEVHASEKTAINGKWVTAPAEDFFTTLLKHFPDIFIIAEDLGVITPDVKEIMERFGFPGMKVLLFAFGEDLPTNPYAPHNHIKNCVVYTGTHDNNTIKGWFRKETGPEDKKRISEYIGRDVTENTIHREIIRLAMMSVADMVIIPMQDILGLGEKYRMNLPASSTGNWEWRLTPEQLSPRVIKELKAMTRIYGRGG